jgi:hypothetical protein
VDRQHGSLVSFFKVKIREIAMPINKIVATKSGKAAIPATISAIAAGGW